jgi:hypothetical protein
MPSRSRILKFWVPMLAILTGAAIWFWQTRPLVIDGGRWAPGMTFASANVEWTALWGNHAVSLDLMVTSGQGKFKIDMATFAEICASVVADLPKAPFGVTAADIYRVNLIKVGATRINAPIPVVDGKCAIPTGTQILFPSYPAPLQDWELITYEIAVAKGDEGVKVVLRQRKDVLASLKSPPFEEACEAVINERVLAERNLTSYLDGKWVRIEFRSEKGNWFFNFNTKSNRVFDIVSGVCLATEIGQDA